MARSKKSNGAGKLSIKDMRDLINKKAGQNVAHDLKEDNPTEVKEWIRTGSRWLDSITCRGRLAGIPVGKVTEIAGLESTGKSYMAAQVAANAQDMGIDVIYFDSESAIDPTFLERAGCDLNNLLYVQATSVEFVLETIEELLGSNDNRMLFIWDSLALTPSVSDVEGDFNPLSSMAVKARILAKGMSKLTVPIANSQSTFLVLNQLKTNITRSPSEAMTTPYMTPGGKAMIYAYSLRIWLTGRKAKASFVTDDKGFRIGSEVKVKLEKSRFGTQGRQCNFRILWGDAIGVQDEESWFDAINGSPRLARAGAWFSLLDASGEAVGPKFQASKWTERLQEPEFRKNVMEVMDEEVIMKFDKRIGEAADFYEENEEKSE
jgi:recombination protein RecA|tara:strand:- start:361 stop:1491 length:1131 start_codon:yes stop_codon:yes gene_type:complete